MNTLQMIILAGALTLCFAYALLIGLFTISWYRIPLQSSSMRPATTVVSIIIAARNEADTLGACLQSLAAQDYPKQLFEVIVVDDHSIDGTAGLVRNIISADPLRKLILLAADAGSQGKKSAVSKAMDYAAGEWIVTTDADCTMDKQWLSALMQDAGDPGLQMLLAPVVYSQEKSVFGQLQELEFMSLIASSAGAAGLGMPVMCNGANLAYRKNIFSQLNGYAHDQQFASGDDMFLMMKIRKACGSRAIRFVKSPLAIVTTKAAVTFSDFANQRLRWVSKSKGYRDAGVLMTALIVYTFSLCAFISLLAWAAGLIGPWFPLTLFAVKILTDLPLMMAYSRFANRRGLMLWYVPMQFIYLFYVVLFGALGNVMQYRWKGRELK